ncbi:MAG: hypothetical protein ACK5MY_10985 [Jhaorihella sp.]
MNGARGLGPDGIKALIAEEVAGFQGRDRAGRIALADFRAALTEPEAVPVQFSGGLVQECWAVTRANGPYRVVFMPVAGYFSLCVEGPFGPLDIGVHGSAIDCFGSV